ncbi:MAG: AAA family ATPase, partial [Neptuniibacter sp.]
MDSLQQLIHPDNQGNTLELLSSLCKCAIAIDEHCKVTWISDAYCELIEIPNEIDPIGKPIEELLPTTQMPRVVKSGKPLFIDLMLINNRWCVVTRLPVRNPEQK